MNTADPRLVLGLGPAPSADDVRAARRRLAKALHPDAGGSAEAMGAVNAAADAVLADLSQPSPAAQGLHAPNASAPGSAGGDPFGAATFTVEALPAEAFEALLVVTTWIGELLVDEPPYQLEAELSEPLACWCRLTLVPDAGASTVAVSVAPVGDGPAPDVGVVRDVWVAGLNELGAAPDGWR